MLVVLAAEGRFGALFAEDAELFCWGLAGRGRWEGGGRGGPGERMACHSSSVFWTGYDMVARLELEKSDPRNGIVGMDLSVGGRRGEAAAKACWWEGEKRRAAVLLRV